MTADPPTTEEPTCPATVSFMYDYDAGKPLTRAFRVTPFSHEAHGRQPNFDGPEAMNDATRAYCELLQALPGVAPDGIRIDGINETLVTVESAQVWEDIMDRLLKLLIVDLGTTPDKVYIHFREYSWDTLRNSHYGRFIPSEEDRRFKAQVSA